MQTKTTKSFGLFLLKVPDEIKPKDKVQTKTAQSFGLSPLKVPDEITEAQRQRESS